MKRLLFPLLAAPALPTAVNASVPYIYVNGGNMGDNESLKECLKIATREMKIAGFTKYIDSSINKDNKLSPLEQHF